jgi:hypothetical protein
MKTVKNFWLENGVPKPEVKIALVMDDYKLANKNDWWERGIGKLPAEFDKLYRFDREQIGPGITDKTVTVFRWFKLRYQSKATPVNEH